MKGTVNDRGEITREGVLLGEWRIRLDYDDRCPTMETFYRDLAERTAESFCRGELRERVLGEYGRDPDPQKRFHYRPLRYSLEGEIRCADGETVSLCLEARLHRQGTRSEDLASADAQVWELTSGCLLPPEEILKRWKEPPLTRGERRAGAILLPTERGILLWNGREWQKRSPRAVKN